MNHTNDTSKWLATGRRYTLAVLRKVARLTGNQLLQEASFIVFVVTASIAIFTGNGEAAFICFLSGLLFATTLIYEMRRK